MKGFKPDRQDEEDAIAVHERTLDLLVKHGLLDHGKGGISRNREFAQLWVSYIPNAPTMHEALANAIRERTGGAENEYSVLAMMNLYCQTYRGTSVGEELEQEEEWVGRGGRGAALRRKMEEEGAQGVRRMIRRAREELEAGRL